MNTNVDINLDAHEVFSNPDICLGSTNSWVNNNRGNNIDCADPLPKPKQDTLVRIKEFDNKIAKRIAAGDYRNFIDKLHYQKALRQYVDLTFLTCDPCKYLFMTFHLRPGAKEAAVGTLRHYFNRVDRKIFRSQHSNGRKQWLARFPVMEGTTPYSRHYHILVENPDCADVERRLNSEWTDLREKGWCFADHKPHLEHCRDHTDALNYITKFRTKPDVREAVDWENVRLSPFVHEWVQTVPDLRW